MENFIFCAVIIVDVLFLSTYISLPETGSQVANRQNVDLTFFSKIVFADKIFHSKSADFIEILCQTFYLLAYV